MRSIVYFSIAAQAMSGEELAALWQECALNDSHVGITGILLHKQGEFLQAIEGPKGVVCDMYARIVTDPRHNITGKISDRMITHREFPGTAMSFKNLDEAPADTPFLEPFSYGAFLADPDLALLTLKYFYWNRNEVPADAVVC
jgi:hypothetical protein